METWPSYLPNPTTSYKIDTVPNIERTRMSSGYSRQRERDLRNTFQSAIVYEMSDAQYQIFVYFHRNKLNNGNDWFNAPILSGGHVVNHEIRIVDGKYNAQYLDFMFWRVTIKVDVKEVNITSFDYFELITNSAFPPDYWSSGVLDALELCVNGRII